MHASLRQTQSATAPRQDGRPRVRTARHATQRRISRKERAKYRTLVQFVAALTLILGGFMLYLELNARLTSLNYAYVKAQRERAILQAQTARLDEQLAQLRSDERLSALAARLHMQDPQSFAMVTLPAAPREPQHTHLAFLSGLATLFGAK